MPAYISWLSKSIKKESTHHTHHTNLPLCLRKKKLIAHMWMDDYTPDSPAGLPLHSPLGEWGFMTTLLDHESQPQVAGILTSRQYESRRVCML